ncbi:uncharacterized protein [Choristoneura fumiferana]
MKLFILAALIAVSSAARLEHLERGYLPPDQGNQGQGFGPQGQGSFGGPGSHGSHNNGIGSHGSNGFGSHGSNGDSAGFGSSPVGSRNGPSAFHGGSSFNAATSNQYLPPDHGPSGSSFPRPGGSRSQDAFGASSNQNQFGSQPNSQYGAGSNGFGSQGSNGFGSQGSSGFGSQGSNGFGSQSSNGFGSQGSNGFGSQGSNGFGSNARSQQGSRVDASRQYLAPKTSSSFDRIPQQSFDEETGYHYWPKQVNGHSLILGLIDWTSIQFKNMYLFQVTFLAIVALCSAAQLPRTYLPSQGSQNSGFQQNQFHSSSSSSSSQGSISGGGTGNRRPQQEAEKNADILKQDTEVGETGFQYSFETSNGIRAEESNNNGQSQGGFSYKGDDGNTYTITFTAGEGGYKPQGAHLPVAPPTPEAILLALQQNAKDEAAGIFDDGKYNPAVHGGDMSGSGGSGSSFNSFQSSSSSSGFGSSTHQASFNPNTGYKY